MRELYVYKIQPTRPEMLVEGATPFEEKVISDHFTYLQDLRNRGVVILAGRTLNIDESSFGIVIFKAASEDEALKVMQSDPAIQQGVMRGELFPFRIALTGDIAEAMQQA
jgi:uncharacterized protein YciI